MPLASTPQPLVPLIGTTSGRATSKAGLWIPALPGAKTDPYSKNSWMEAGWPIPNPRVLLDRRPPFPL